MLRTWMKPGKMFLLMMTSLSLLYFFIRNENTSIIEASAVEKEIIYKELEDNANILLIPNEIPSPVNLTSQAEQIFPSSRSSNSNNITEMEEKLDLLKEVSLKTYSEIMEATLRNKPLGSRPRSRSMQIIIATTWRSGSTFLEELIESHSGFYNSYEPLLIYGMRNFYDASEKDAQHALKIVMNILKCKYEPSYIQKAKITSKELFSRNSRVWQACKNSDDHNALCYQQNFLETVCPFFPWSLMKLVRLGINLLRPVLEDRSLNSHIIYLVRDPRAVINSRMDTVKWCTTAVCSDPTILCKHMEEDLKAYLELSSLFPGKLHIVRYEDLSLSPLNVTQNLLQDMDLDFDPLMQNFISTHTTTNHDVPWSTSRESAKRVLYWTKKIKKSTLDNIQNVCSAAMKKFGYLPIHSTKYISIKDVLGPLRLLV